MRISFLIVNYNMRGLVEKCVRSILQQLSGLNVEHEILIADNSTEDEHAVSEKQLPGDWNAKVVRLDENRGLVDALNRILPEANGDLIFLLHPDIEFKPGCLKRIIEFMQNNPQAGIVSPNLIYPDGSPNRIRLAFPTVKTELARTTNIVLQILFGRKPLSDEVFWEREDNAETEMVMSVCLVMRKAVLAEIGQVTDKLKIYYSNDYLCMRAMRSGWKIFYIKDAVLVHYERYADTSSYSESSELEYKRSPVPIVDRMERDKFAFYRLLYPWHTVFALKLIATIEYGIHMVSAVKRHRRLRNDESRQYRKCIGVIWFS